MEEHHIIQFTAATGDDTNLTVICGIYHFLVHEKVLAPQSKYFENAMTVEMREKKERRIEVQEQDPYVVQAFRFFAYKQQYDDRSGNNPDRDEEMTFNAKVYALAEEWQFPSLKALAKDKLDDLVKTKYTEYDFTNAIRIAYSSTPAHDTGLRLIAARKSSEKYHELCEMEAFKVTIQEVPGFGADVAASLASSAKQGGQPGKRILKRYFCSDCGRTTSLPKEQVCHCDQGRCFYCGYTMYWKDDYEY